MWSVLESIYDGPIDTVNFEPSPVILKALPTLGQSGVTLQNALVTAGDVVANTEGDIVALEKGTRVFAEGCTSPDCAITWDGVSPLNLTQMVVRFSLLENIKWSDGKPLTAADSVFSYEISADAATNVSKTNIKRTFSYKALDETTLEWVGQPGYLTMNPAAFFWIPLPKHLLADLGAEKMKTDELTTRKPLGWGPYQIDEWVSNDHIRLVKNPNYFRNGEGLPYYDVVVYRFLRAVPEADLSPVVTGECDIIDTSVALENQIKSIRELEVSGKIKGYYGMGPEWEGLNFGIKPASYDDVYNPYLDRQDFFSDTRVRQAFAYCIDRESIISNVLLSQSTVPETYLPPTHPYAGSGFTSYPHDPTLGNKLLQEAGWVDQDGDPSTPRVAAGVENVIRGTEFSINYYLTESTLHATTAEIVVKSLAECGIQVTPTYLNVEDMYASGPDGLVFGRNFDLAELAWSTGRQPSCFLYASSEIPMQRNNWLGTKYGGVNFTGFENQEYDLACSESLTSGLNAELFHTTNQRMQEILAEQLPVLPLFYHVKAMVSRSDLCGLTLDVSSRSPLKDIELLHNASKCGND
jgi:peptide/nickel transport system substrate-binding protein